MKRLPFSHSSESPCRECPFELVDKLEGSPCASCAAVGSVFPGVVPMKLFYDDICREQKKGCVLRDPDTIAAVRAAVSDGMSIPKAACKFELARATVMRICRMSASQASAPYYIANLPHGSCSELVRKAGKSINYLSGILRGAFRPSEKMAATLAAACADIGLDVSAEDWRRGDTEQIRRKITEHHDLLGREHEK